VNKYLIVVEGEVGEFELLESGLERYGYIVEKRNKKVGVNFNEIMKYESEKDIIYIVQGKYSRISEMIRQFQDYDSLESYFGYHPDTFVGIYFIYDVDHTTNQELNLFFNKFNSSDKGLLLFTNPCIECIVDKCCNDTLIYEKLRFYKKDVRKKVEKKLGMNINGSIAKYIGDNLEDLLIFHIKKNQNRFKSNNVLEHPQLVLDEMMKTNVQSDDGKLHFEYITTVIYVLIAEIKKLTYKRDNVELLIEFLSKYIS